jgi:purine-nucleoside phosphorylase
VTSGTPFEEFRARCEAAAPAVFVVLGSGIGPLIARVKVESRLAYTDIPGLPASSVEGHRGCLTLGEWAGQRVIVAEGRLHYFEGHQWEVVVRPIQLAAELGARAALLTNAVGGIREDLEPGSLMPVRDHLEWNRPSPWGNGPEASPYSPRLVERICAGGKACGLDLKPGVYGAVTGPTYETPAEVRALRSAGVDAVGMSTSREILAGAQHGLECGAISLVTNRAAGLAAGTLSHEEVLATARATAEVLGRVLEVVLIRLFEDKTGR